jgi:hypothetical protein
MNRRVGSCYDFSQKMLEATAGLLSDPQSSMFAIAFFDDVRAVFNAARGCADRLSGNHLVKRRRCIHTGKAFANITL